MRGRLVFGLQCSALLIAGVFAIPTEDARAEHEGIFKGSWIASGTRQLLDFAEDREVFTFHVEGHLNLEDDVGKISDFWSECIGLWDALKGGNTRCVWRSLGGDKIYSELSGHLMEEQVAVQGKFIGGTGKAEGIEGEFTLTSSSIFYNGDERILTLHSKDIAGSYRIPLGE